MIMSFAWWFLRTPEGFNHWYVNIFHDECCLPLVLSTITDDFNVYSFRYGDEGNVHARSSILYASFPCQGQSIDGYLILFQDPNSRYGFMEHFIGSSYLDGIEDLNSSPLEMLKRLYFWLPSLLSFWDDLY